MALALRLDAPMTAARAAGSQSEPSRLVTLLRMLRQDGGAYMCVQEFKASGQVHWQALLYTSKPAQSFRDVFRTELGCKKTEYSVVQAPTPDGFERYLCKGPHGKRGELPTVVGHYGVKYTEAFFGQQHEQWYNTGEKIKSEKRGRAQEKKNFMMLCEDAMRTNSVEMTLSNCVKTVLGNALKLRKMYSRTQLIWTAQMMFANGNATAQNELMRSMVMEAEELFSAETVRASNQAQQDSPYADHAIVEDEAGRQLSASSSESCGDHISSCDCSTDSSRTSGACIATASGLAPTAQDQDNGTSGPQEERERDADIEHRHVACELQQGQCTTADPCASLEASEPEQVQHHLLDPRLFAVGIDQGNLQPVQHVYYVNDGSVPGSFTHV